MFRNSKHESTYKIIDNLDTHVDNISTGLQCIYKDVNKMHDYRKITAKFKKQIMERYSRITSLIHEACLERLITLLHIYLHKNTYPAKYLFNRISYEHLEWCYDTDKLLDKNLAIIELYKNNLGQIMSCIKEFLSQYNISSMLSIIKDYIYHDINKENVELLYAYIFDYYIRNSSIDINYP